MKILLSEAHNWCNASRSKLYNDARDGLISTQKDPHRGNKKVIDTAELERAYGSIHDPNENSPETEINGNGQPIETEKLIQLYENRIQDLQKQLELASTREETLTAEKSKLLDLTDRLQKQNELLMLPPVPEKKSNWVERLTGR
jgi:hypothetical protein